MNNLSVRIICFSPTGTTRRIARAIAAGAGCAAPIITDLTKPENRNNTIKPLSEDLVILAMPVYEERIPALVTPVLETLHGQNQPCLLVAVYGNVGFGIALKQLYKAGVQAGLKPLAAGAFVGEHSFSRPSDPLAAGRPDTHDLQFAADFGSRISELMTSNNSHALTPQQIPGRLPLMASILGHGSAKLFTMQPGLNRNCTHCTACVHFCPAGAIRPDMSIDETLCLRCFACVKRCERSGRDLHYRFESMVKRFLKKADKRQKSPLLVFASPNNDSETL